MRMSQYRFRSRKPFSFFPQKRETEKARRLVKTQSLKDAESQSFFVSLSLCDSVSLISSRDFSEAAGLTAKIKDSASTPKSVVCCPMLQDVKERISLLNHIIGGKSLL